ncbi:MAG: DUF3990 domain-containing protein [Prevotellaceae bacterium]|jgi:hypothetical protein|nr:DUF3990 domain-containing protein [Prevotellaceae bacterium]
MKVFHGSDTRIEKIDLARGKEHPDFGRGFYVTRVRGHAHRRAVDIALANRTAPIVTEYEYNEVYPVNMQLQVKQFPDVSEEWVRFVIMNRDMRIAQPAHSYDIVEGPIANDWVTYQIRRYQKGKITLEQLIKALQYRETTHQICFCTPESLWALDVVEDDTRFDQEDMHSLIIEMLMNEFNITEMEATRRFYRSTVFANLSDTETDLYKQPWQQIYEILKKELQK